MPPRERERRRESEPERSASERFYDATPKSRARYERATESMPGGNTRNVMYFDPYPAYADRGSGAKIRDVDGNEYLDFVNNYTSLIHGHAPEGPVERAVEAVRRGSAPGMPTDEEIEWADHLVDRVPAVDYVRFTNSGTEATMNAIRAARAYTGRDVIATFEGSYHGTHDDVLVSVHPPTGLAGPKSDPNTVPESAGIPESTLDDVISLPFNDAEAAIEKLERHRDELGGVLVAPLMGSAVVPAEEAFLERIDAYTSRHDVPLVFDEVISFRVSHGGAAASFGIEPDLIAFGKIIGGGFPVGAFGGREDVMEVYDPRGGSDVVHSGTFNANPVTAAAGIAALEAYTPEEIDRLNGLCEILVSRSRELVDDHGLEVQINQYGSLFNVYLTDEAVRDYRTAHGAHDGLTNELYLELLTEGVRLAPKLMGSLSTPMDEDDVETFLETFDTALGRLRPKFERKAPQLIVD